ncbi:hypothetical protein K8Q93_02425 [Candidatus Parcubacteria bacterium]|nr:hypothetical protein [Candidatus Parcubacteria bacterium]
MMKAFGQILLKTEESPRRRHIARDLANMDAGPIVPIWDYWIKDPLQRAMKRWRNRTKMSFRERLKLIVQSLSEEASTHKKK